VLRSGARPGDVVAVAGVLGEAAAGLRLLFAEGVVDGSPDREAAAAVRAAHPALISAQLAPRPPIFAGREAAIAGATAMLDLSDGLALDARRMALASGVAIDLDSALVGSREALDGGEDHSLLATFPANAIMPEAFRVIGGVRAAGGSIVPTTASASAAAPAPTPAHTSASAIGPTAGPGVFVNGRPYTALGGWDPYAGWNGGVG
jgi:thiamine-monophosphate kinase